MTRFALPLIVLALAAAAPPPPEPESPQIIAAEHAAERLLAPCSMSKTHPAGSVVSANDVCINAQQSFIQHYVMAFSGSSMDALGEAEEYSQVDRKLCAAKPECEEVTAPQWIGIPVDQTEACVWTLVALALEKPQPWEKGFEEAFGRLPTTLARTAMRHQCAPLSTVEDVRASKRAAALVLRIADHPVDLPSGWWLGWPDIKPFEMGHRPS